MPELSKTFTFEASHILDRHKGKCGRLHGHSWVLKVYVKGPIDPDTGFVMDFYDLKKVVQPLIDAVDHRHLGTWSGIGISIQSQKWRCLPLDFYPSSENLLLWFASELYDSPGFTLPWSKLELSETCTSSCMLTKEEYDTIRIRGKVVGETK
jgi:6-pyruvoyltetrahydropterin/6-carboxytetrahydropterin synthase